MDVALNMGGLAGFDAEGALRQIPFYGDLFDAIPAILNNKIQGLVAQGNLADSSYYLVEPTAGLLDAGRIPVWRLGTNMGIRACPHPVNNGPANLLVHVDHTLHGCFNPTRKGGDFALWFISYRSQLAIDAPVGDRIWLEAQVQAYFQLWNDETPQYAGAIDETTRSICRLVRELRDQTLCRSADVGTPIAWLYTHQVHGVLHWANVSFHGCLHEIMRTLVVCKHARLNPNETAADAIHRLGL